jgi:hypothetical protein
MCRKLIYLVSFVLVLGSVSNAADIHCAITVPDAGFDDHVLNYVGDYIYIGDSSYSGAWKSDYGEGGAWIDYNYWEGDLPARSGHNKAYPSDTETFDYIYQILDETFVEGGTYTLSVWVGNAWPGEGYADGWSLYFTGEDYKINLKVANGLALLGDWEQVSLVYTATAADAGKKIGIKMAGEQGESYIAFEDVTLWYDGPPWPIATNPIPADDAEHDDDRVTLIWTAGATAVEHDVYFGTDFDDVKDATASEPPVDPYKGRQTDASYEVYDLVPGTTYYWRIDELEADGTTIHKGKVWSFWFPPWEAYNPSPPDGAKWVATDADLSWSAGATGIKHDVYFGTDQTDVANGTGGTLKSSQQTTTTYDPGTLALDTTYYWRIDEYDSSGKKYPGEVWTFRTIGANAGIRGYYFNNMNVSGAAALVRIDSEINFNWGSGTPGAPIPVDLFSVRWVGVVEALYSEPYTFVCITDDGFRLWLNDVLIIDSWVDQAPTILLSPPINLVAGQLYGIRVEYYENGGGAMAQLYWQSPSTPRQIVPVGALQLPLSAINPSPPNGAVDVKHTPTLRWSVGEKAVKHNVYLGTDATAVANATTASAGIYRGQQNLDVTSYIPSEAPLAWNSTYYWRIDEVNAADTWKGRVWSFTTANFIVVDDFEDYTDDVGSRIFQTWKDGLGWTQPAPGYPGNGTGSAVGNSAPPYAEQTIVHGGGQSMPLAYDNSGTGGKTRYSETQREWASPQDWTTNNVKALTLWFYGDPNNAPEGLYVAVEDNAGHIKVMNYPDVEAVQKAAWQEWNIELTQFSGAGVNLQVVKKMYIGLGNRTSPKVGGTGTIFIDDIGVYRSRCVPSMGKPAADLSGNCVVDYADIEIMASAWLNTGAALAADLNADNDVDLKDYAILADAWLEEILWP